MAAILEGLDSWHTAISNFEYVPQKSFMAYWPIPIGTSFVYLFTVFTLKKVMENRPALKLKEIVLVHNFFMTLISASCFLGMVYFLAKMAIQYSFDPEVFFCDTAQKEVNKGGLYFVIYIFYLSKYYELLDTCLICLRKGNLQFLHAYHHWATLILIYVCLEVKLPVQWCAEVLNALVHIPMYYYYLLTCLNVKDVWWKKYLTQLQIIQFILVDGFHLTSFYYHYGLGRQCSSFDTWGNQFGFCIINSYLVLFILFYRQTYKHKKN